MLIVALAIVLAPLAWLVIKRLRSADPAARGTGLRWVMVSVGAALALRVGLTAPILLRVALGLLAVAALVIWLRKRGHGDDGRGDDGRDAPDDPGPEPRPDHAVPRPDRLDPEQFDRARAAWEDALKKHSPD